MQKITDLRGIKDTAKVFLHMNIEETKFSPLVIKHPFTDSAMVCLSQIDGEIAFANIQYYGRHKGIYPMERTSGKAD